MKKHFLIHSYSQLSGAYAQLQKKMHIVGPVINDPNLNCKKTNPLKRKNPFCFLQNGLLKNYREDPK